MQRLPIGSKTESSLYLFIIPQRVSAGHRFIIAPDTAALSA